MIEGGQPQPAPPKQRAADPLVGTGRLAPGIAAPTSKLIVSFEGIGATGVLPPDTVGDVGPNHYVQMVNSAFAMAVNITRSFKLYGWCSRIRGVESGGAVESLPVHTFPTDDGGVDMKCPTEIAISDRREAELAKNGFMPLLHRKNSDLAAFIGAQSLQKPFEYVDPDATANANL